MDEHTTTDTDDRGRERASTLRAAAVGAGLGIFTVIGIGAGTSALAGAQDDPPAEESTTDDAPERGEHLADALAPLVEDGTLTQEQADAVVERLRDAGAEARERWGDRGGRGPGAHFPGPGSEAVAELLGTTPEELRESLQGGATLAELAEAAGVTTEDLLDAMLSGVEEHLAQRVADGDLTQEEADERLARATERATAVIDGERPQR